MLITLLKEEISVVEDTRPGGPEPKVKKDRGLLSSRILLKKVLPQAGGLRISPAAPLSFEELYQHYISYPPFLCQR